MDARPRDDEVTHEPFANVRLAELIGKSDAAANHNASTRGNPRKQLSRRRGKAVTRASVSSNSPPNASGD
jgi:hypothetical protein